MFGLGEMQERALKEVKVAMRLWLETAKEIGREIPVPQKRSLVASLPEKQQLEVPNVAILSYSIDRCIAKAVYTIAKYSQ
jgi:hypothetical protein